ncbi:hypothetical protein [Caldicellulosiruptor naganoensis]|uniref:hypothetical protein n=1 Tax=Caldicellulosiruptor naganoensis TaxID=29324 RepID=UPI001F2D07E6|nr:hypothetical protein [Caldicellulosiruptor naganoensis]
MIVLLLLIILILYSFTNFVAKERSFRFERKLNLIIGLVVTVLMCGIVIIGSIVSRFACTLI